MQKFTKTTRTLAALLVSGTALTGVASAAEISGNVGATTDYIWRGNDVPKWRRRKLVWRY